MRHLSNKEKKALSEILPPGYEIKKKDEITENKGIIYRGDEKFLIIIERNKKIMSKVIPHLRTLNDKELKSVYVDLGAIPFIIKGANIMRPGIQKIDPNIKKGETILVKDEGYKKTLAIGEALFNSEEMQRQEKGISVNILHYMGDEKF